MKRAAAIIGPTPSFVRWTILQPCPFRQIDDSHPYEAFRQLRNLREVSLGLIETGFSKDSAFTPHKTKRLKKHEDFRLTKFWRFLELRTKLKTLVGSVQQTPPSTGRSMHQKPNGPVVMAGCDRNRIQSTWLTSSIQSPLTISSACHRQSKTGSGSGKMNDGKKINWRF